MTCFEKARQLERIRLLHAELSDLLRLFSLCYGPLLLNLFTFGFVDMLFFFFFVICMEYPPGPTTTQNFLRKALSLMVNVHAVIYITTVLAVGSRVNEKVNILEDQRIYFVQYPLRILQLGCHFPILSSMGLAEHFYDPLLLLILREEGGGT